MRYLKELFMPKKILVLMLVDLVIAIILTTLMMIRIRVPLLELFIGNLIYSNCIGFLIYSGLTGLDFLRMNKRIRVVLIALVLISAGIVGGFIGAKINRVLLGWDFQFFNISNMLLFIALSIIFGISAYVLFTLIHANNMKALRLSQEKAARIDAELMSLRHRVNPHFLFNTLNSISGLIYIDKEKADRMVQMLSDLLRYNLDVSKNILVPLDAELEIVEKYLQIESIRFGNRLMYSIENIVEDIEVPPLTVLTLVENAIKHGISKLSSGGSIIVKCFNEGQNTIISVLNDCDKVATSTDTGFGLKSVRGLLKQSGVVNGELSINYSDEGFEARIVLEDIDEL